MPTYDYKCRDCGCFEHFQKITDDALKTCPKCGEKVERLISKNIGVIYKGSGFYTTDYNRSSSYKSQADKEKGQKTSSNKGDSSKKDKAS